MLINITLNEAETKALSHVTADPNEWAENVVRERARISMEQIFQQELPKIMASGDLAVLAGGIEAVVLAADLTSPPVEEPPAAP